MQVCIFKTIRMMGTFHYLDAGSNLPTVIIDDVLKNAEPTNTIHTDIVTTSLTTPAIVTVTALVTETRMYSVNTCKKRNNKVHIIIAQTLV